MGVGIVTPTHLLIQHYKDKALELAHETAPSLARFLMEAKAAAIQAEVVADRYRIPMEW